MGLCKGNLGNLMQHWVLCEALTELSVSGISKLFFFTTHSMAPRSVLEPRLKGASIFHRYFDSALSRLFEQNEGQRPLAPYEQAWKALAPPAGVPYPSSAAFAVNRWLGPLSLWLCEFPADDDENNRNNGKEIQEWFETPEIQQLFQRRLREMAWQRCLSDKRDLEMVLDRANQCDLAFIECDPDQIISQQGGSHRNGRNIYCEDLRLICSLIQRLSVPCVLQLSSYGTQGGYTPEVIEPVVSEIMATENMILRGRVVTKNTMTSLVYTHRFDLWGDDPDEISDSFNNWLP